MLPADRTDRDAPMIPGRLYGIRAWSILRGSGRLVSPVAGTWWAENGRATFATCTANASHLEEPPVSDCGCGLYGIHPYAPWRFAGDVIGIVEGWGPCELHKNGFRARCARPHVLAVFSGQRRGLALVRRAAEVHNAGVIEVEDLSDLSHYCKQAGLGLDPSTVAQLLGIEVAFLGVHPPKSYTPPPPPDPTPPSDLKLFPGG